MYTCIYTLEFIYVRTAKTTAHGPTQSIYIHIYTYIYTYKHVYAYVYI